MACLINLFVIQVKKSLTAQFIILNLVEMCKLMEIWTPKLNNSYKEM